MSRLAARVALCGILAAAGPAAASELDRRVGAFLDAQRGAWSRGINYWNVPYEDGRILHDLVARGGHRRILEIGTSTGHSTVWLAWAAAKTGGRVTTIEIDPARHRRALENLREAGVSEWVDARLGDAHELVPALSGSWDFVFQDADKEWYLRYWDILAPRIAPGGCYTAHNVLRPASREVEQFVAAAGRAPGFATRFEDGGSGEGISVTCRVEAGAPGQARRAP